MKLVSYILLALLSSQLFKFSFICQQIKSLQTSIRIHNNNNTYNYNIAKSNLKPKAMQKQVVLQMEPINFNLDIFENFLSLYRLKRNKKTEEDKLTSKLYKKVRLYKKIRNPLLKQKGKGNLSHKQTIIANSHKVTPKYKFLFMFYLFDLPCYIMKKLVILLIIITMFVLAYNIFNYLYNFLRLHNRNFFKKVSK